MIVSKKALELKKGQKMIEIKTTKEIILNAYYKAIQMGELKNSIMNGKGNFIGFVGEAAVKSFFNIPLNTDQNTYDYDIILENHPIDVKSKKTSVVPSLNFECSVAAYNTKQKCKYYLFTRVYHPKDKRLPVSVYLMGYYPKELYYKNARFLKKGQIDGTNGFVVRDDCFNMYYQDLYPIKELVKTNI